MEVSGRKHKDIKEILCEPCFDLGQNLLAAGFCIDCNDFLCKACYKHHHKPRVYRNHVLLGENAMPNNKPEKKSSNVADKADRCSKHKGDLITFYCRSDRKLGCGSCMITSHRRCEELISIEEEYEKIDNDIIKFNEQLDSHSQTKEQNSNKVGTNHSQAVDHIKHFFQYIKGFFENLEDKMINEADKLKDDDEKKMKSISATCLTLRNELHSLASELAKLHQTQQNGQLLTKMEEAKDQVKAIAKNIDQMKIENKVHVYSFVPKKQIQEMMGSLTALGNLATEKETCKGNQIDLLQRFEEDNYSSNRLSSGYKTALQNLTSTGNTPQCPFKTRKAYQDSNLDISHISQEEIKELPVTGLTLLFDNHLILVDSNYRIVKLLNVKQKKKTSELQLSFTLYDITAIDNNQVAMTMPDANQIQMLSISNQNISLGQTIKVKGQCRGIVHNDGIFIVTYLNPAKIELISISGNVLRRIVKGTNTAPLFVQPLYIALSLDKTYVYISDYAKHSVTCMTLDGEVKGVYKDEGLRNPRGLTVDRTGSVYVVGGFDPYYIYQISVIGSRGQILVGKGLFCPSSIAYCHKEDKLYVGDLTTIIKVFQLT